MLVTLILTILLLLSVGLNLLWKSRITALESALNSKTALVNEQFLIWEENRSDLQTTYLKNNILRLLDSISRKNLFLNSLLTRVQAILQAENPKRDVQLNKLAAVISEEMNSKVEWKNFLDDFELLNGQYISNFKEKFPDLSFSDFRLIALIKMELSSQEIAQLLHVSMDGLKKARYRLRKKIGADSNTGIHEFLETSYALV